MAASAQGELPRGLRGVGAGQEVMMIQGHRCAADRPFYGLRSKPKCYISRMTTTEDIEKAVEQLAPRELARFRAWFEAFDAAQFDVAIERDVSAGKLDAHAEEALTAHRAGRSRDL